MNDSDTEVLEGIAEEPPEDEDLPGRLSKAAPRKWFNRATPALLGVFLLAGGFLGGVAVQKQWGKDSSSGGTSVAATAGGFSGQMPGGMSASGMPGGGFGGNTAGGGTTTGTLKSVTSSALTMTTAAGKTVTVKIAESTKVQQATTLAELTAGQSLSVQGSTATDGSITATSVTAS